MELKKKVWTPTERQIGVTVNAALPAVMGNDLSAMRRGLSDKMMSLYFVYRISWTYQNVGLLIGANGMIIS
jgi:hypothetical protein